MNPAGAAESGIRGGDNRHLQEPTLTTFEELLVATGSEDEYDLAEYLDDSGGSYLQQEGTIWTFWYLEAAAMPIKFPTTLSQLVKDTTRCVEVGTEHQYEIDDEEYRQDHDVVLLGLTVDRGSISSLKVVASAEGARLGTLSVTNEGLAWLPEDSGTTVVLRWETFSDMVSRPLPD